MAEQVSDFKRGENKARALTVGVLSATFLIAAMAPQNTRAVFITDGGLPKAFTATLASNGAGIGPGTVSNRNASYLSGLADPRTPGADRGSRRSEIPPAGFVLGARPLTPVAPGGAAPGAVGPVAETPAPLPPVDVASVGTGGTGPTAGGQPFAPIIQQPGAGSSGFVGTTPGGGTPGSPGSGTPGAGNPGTVPASPTPAPAVPEPSTWIMLLSGFLVVGSALRIARQTRRATLPG